MDEKDVLSYHEFSEIDVYKYVKHTNFLFLNHNFGHSFTVLVGFLFRSSFLS